MNCEQVVRGFQVAILKRPVIALLTEGYDLTRTINLL